MARAIDTVVGLVHERDALLAERLQLTAQLDSRIAAVEARLEQMLSGTKAETQPVATAIGRTIIERVAEQIRQKPTLGIGELAMAVYGADTPKARHNIRAQVWQLKKSGRYPQRSDNGAKTMSP